MAEILVIGKKISEMGLVNEITGEEKIPTSALGDKAVTTDQLLTYVNNNGVGNWGRIGGDINNQVDLQNQFTQERNTLKSYTDGQVSQQQAALQDHIDSTNEVFEYTRENGSALPYREDIAYEENAVVVKEGVLQQWVGGEWKPVVAASLSDTVQTFNTPEAGIDPITGVADGAYFNVRSLNDDSYVDEYQNVGGSAVATGKSYPSSSVVQVIRDDVSELTANTAYFYHTVSAMVADETLTDGKIVATKGYQNIFDGGGATYLISAVATDYSIPLANGLHAVFRDSFDIRKFGIQDNATLDQTSNLTRMVAYADTRVYEIDFLNFSIMTPKSWAWVATRGVLANTTTPINVSPSQVMGLNFNYCHKLKNLRITHDKTTRLNTSQNLINFLPLANPDTEQWFELENVTFDPWVDNYQPRTENYLGNYDGMRHGLFCHPARDSTIPQWAETATNISFKFKNVHFESPAYSYNLTTSAIHAKNVVLENLTGQYMGIYVNYMAKFLVGKFVHGVRRYELMEAGRTMVGNLIHYEAEMTDKSAVYELVDLDDISGIDSVTGLPASAYVYKGLGTTTNKIFRLRKVEGHSRLDNVSSDHVTIEDSDNLASFQLLNTSRIDKLTLRNYTTSNHQGSLGSNPYMLASTEFGEVELDNCKLPYALYPSAASRVVKVGKLIVKNTEISNATDGVARGANFRVDKFEATNIKPNSSNGRIIWCDIGTAVIDGVDYTEEGTTTNTLATTINNTNPTAADITVKNINSKRNNAPSDNQFLGAMNLTLINSVFNVRPKIPSTINLTESAVYPKIGGSKTFDPPSIAVGASTTTTVTATGIRLGDFVQASFTQYHADIRIEAQVSADNTVTVKFTNTGAAPVDLPSGTLAVMKV